jgi:hypothetical protein
MTYWVRKWKCLRCHREHTTVIREGVVVGQTRTQTTWETIWEDKCDGTDTWTENSAVGAECPDGCIYVFDERPV